MPAIETRGLSRSFGDLKAVDQIDLSIEQGELFSLLGPNGAGKTTTIKMLCCLTRPTSGTATVMGHDIREDPLSVKQVIDVSPQETAIAEHLSAAENLALIAGLYGIELDTAKARADELLAMLGLTERATDRVKKLSGGMKRRLSIAMALVSDPQILFLDEPTLGLDPQSRRAIWEHISALKGEKTILLTTHYLEEADELADRIAIIDEGRIVALGSADELKAGIGGESETLVEISNLGDQVFRALEDRFRHVSVTDAGVSIRAADVNLADVQRVLQPVEAEVQSLHRKQLSLDDVFLHYTGKQLRE